MEPQLKGEPAILSATSPDPHPTPSPPGCQTPSKGCIMHYATCILRVALCIMQLAYFDSLKHLMSIILSVSGRMVWGQVEWGCFHNSCEVCIKDDIWCCIKFYSNSKWLHYIYYISAV